MPNNDPRPGQADQSPVQVEISEIRYNAGTLSRDAVREALGKALSHILNNPSELAFFSEQGVNIAQLLADEDLDIEVRREGEGFGVEGMVYVIMVICRFPPIKTVLEAAGEGVNDALKAVITPEEIRRQTKELTQAVVNWVGERAIPQIRKRKGADAIGDKLPKTSSPDKTETASKNNNSRTL
jgi:hypothetical protein